MIQSGKFDSLSMNIKNIANNLLIFIIKRLIEISGIIISILGVLLFISLLTYSPNDPNFIFPDNTEIKNLLGFRGSYISDLFFQTIGLIAYLIPITFLITGINILKKKEFLLFIESNFYIVAYSLVGSVFFSIFYPDAFNLYANGNGGFIGDRISQIIFNYLNNSYETIIFSSLIVIISILFFYSINLNHKNFIFVLKETFKFIFKKRRKNYTNKNEIIKEYIPQDEIKNLIQEDLPFVKSENYQTNDKTKFLLPSIDLLKAPSKKEREEINKNENNNPEFLEKILLDFGVSGKIKKVSQGPVVTLNEFEPAAGVKVSKIINLSDDIARNTSSESARISTIPGSNTIGIELPNISRENVYLSEILNNSNFKKKDVMN